MNNMDTWFSILITQIPLCVMAILFYIEFYKIRKTLEKLEKTTRNYITKKDKR